MSIHQSFRNNKWKNFRSVRTRRERVEKLMRNYKWVKDMSVYGLPKEILRKIMYKIKKEKTVKKDLVDYAISLPSKEDSTKKKKISRDDKETNRR